MQRGYQRLTRRTLALSLVLGCLAGCQPSAPPPFPRWAPKATSESSSLYRLGSKWAELTKDKKKSSGLEISVAQLDGAVRAPHEFQTRPPFEVDPGRTGWVEIGKSLTRQLAKQLSDGQFMQGCETYLVGERFCLTIARGDGADSVSGFAILSRLRTALAQNLAKFPADALTKLAQGVRFDLEIFPGLDAAADNERVAMLTEIDAVQDAYRDSRLDDLEAKLRPVAHGAIEALRVLRDHDDRRRVDFFKNLAQDLELEFDWIKKAGRLPAIKREPEPPFKANSRRPWQELAHFLFGSGGAMLRSRDLALARTRLLYQNALALLAIRQTGSSPSSLPDKTTTFAQDPYSGELLRYIQRGKGFVVYGVGTDGVDNAGETDATWTEPDLYLEFSNH